MSAPDAPLHERLLRRADLLIELGYGGCDKELREAAAALRPPEGEVGGVMDLIAELARCGLVFINGHPPLTEDGTLLLYTGGCNAIVGAWRGTELRTWEGKRIDEPIDYWMRLPHPSIWPTSERPAEMVDERALYTAAADGLDPVTRLLLATPPQAQRAEDEP